MRYVIGKQIFDKIVKKMWPYEKGSIHISWREIWWLLDSFRTWWAAEGNDKERSSETHSITKGGV